MCFAGTAYQLSRRRLLKGAGAAAFAGAAGIAMRDPNLAAAGVRRSPPGKRHRTGVVLLGTAGGPAWELNHSGIATALRVGDAVYVVDCGEGVWGQYRRAGLGTGPSSTDTTTNLRGVFLTHLHSDHMSDYFNLWMFGFANGFLGRTKPVAVYGPGDRGSLPPLFGPPPAPPVINPSSPTPGIEETSRLLMDAYASDFNDRMRDVRIPDMRTLITPHDIPLPADIVANANVNPSPRMDPFDVFEDDRVKVTATLVDHRPTFPAFGFRFDTQDGSVVISGDTTASPNLVQLAGGADVLVHEVMDPTFPESLFPPPIDPTEEAIIAHLLASHTTTEQVVQVAKEADVDTLVLTHLIPAANSERRWRQLTRGYRGRLIVGEDLLEIGVGRARSNRKPRKG